MTAAEVLDRYRAMFDAARSGRAKFVDGGGCLIEYGRVLGRIERRLGVAAQDEAEALATQLREIAATFREAKGEGVTKPYRWDWLINATRHVSDAISYERTDIPRARCARCHRLSGNDETCLGCHVDAHIELTREEVTE